VRQGRPVGLISSVPGFDLIIGFGSSSSPPIPVRTSALYGIGSAVTACSSGRHEQQVTIDGVTPVPAVSTPLENGANVTLEDGATRPGWMGDFYEGAPRGAVCSDRRWKTLVAWLS